MAFMMKKKKYRFNAELQLHDLDNVTWVNEVIFAKIRLLDGGSFQEYTSRKEVHNHRVEWNLNLQIPCKMSANASTGVLDPCYLRISIRKELKGGRSYFKLGFIDLNLAEYAGAGLITRRWLLEGYDSRHRMDNSMLTLSLKMHMLSGDILFKAPTPSLKSKQKSPNDNLPTISSNDPNLEIATTLAAAATTTTSVSIGIGVGVPSQTIGSSSTLAISNSNSNSDGRPISSFRDDGDGESAYPVVAALVVDSGLSESSESALTLAADALLLQQQSAYASLTGNATLMPGASLSNAPELSTVSSLGSGSGGGGGGGSGGSSISSSSHLGIIGSNSSSNTAVAVGNSSSTATSATMIAPTSIMEVGHSRNSSNTSQVSKGSGYSSFSHSQHSRQSSDADSAGHTRLNQKAIHAMKLHIPASPIYYYNGKKYNCKDAINECDSEDTSLFQTPNCSTRDDINEEFRTPLNEDYSQILIASSQNGKHLNTPSPTYCSINSNSRTPSKDSDLYESGGCGGGGGGGVSGSGSGGGSDELKDNSDSDSTDDSGLEENFHTPRFPKIKSLESLSLLEIEFRKASQYLDRDSPKRLNKLLKGKANELAKMKSLNNLSLENYSFKLLNSNRQYLKSVDKENFKFPNTKSRSKHFDNTREQLEQKKNSMSVINLPKTYLKHNKIGNTKFLGNDDNGLSVQLAGGNIPYPMHKIRSMGTIPDVVSERIQLDPFLTPTTVRKIQFPTANKVNYFNNTKEITSHSPPPPPLSQQSSRTLLLSSSSTNSMEILINLSENNTTITNDVFASAENLSNLRHLNDVYDTAFVSRKPFERAYRKSLMKCSTPLRQELAQNQHTNLNGDVINIQQPIQQQTDMAKARHLIMRSNTLAAGLANVRPRSFNVTCDLLRNPSCGSLVISDTGSLDRIKAVAADKRKKGPLEEGPRVSDRVEETRVNPNSLIDEILKDTKLDQLEESAETSGLQLYIARDGTASLGSHEVKSRASAGAFKQVVMENPR